MAETPIPAAVLPESVSPPSVQPGGGWAVRLEMAWGQLRRAWLRRCRPGYVARMAVRRQGHCPDCPHDIVDPRDLKYVRNVCGFWFRPEHDRFAWRESLGFARYGLAELVIYSLACWGAGLVLAAGGLWLHWTLWTPLPLLLLIWLEVVYFFRDPERAIPADPAVLVSPADGTVTHIEEVEEPDFPSGRALRISIFLSIFNVHVNRAPRGGRVLATRWFPGCFLDARNPDSAIRNEQLWIDLEEPGGRPLRVKQISGAIARRIVCWLKPGDTLEVGQRIGMIKFGSRTDVLLPAGESLKRHVQVGDKVRGGASVLVSFGKR